jgi:hypothetical protein
MADDDYEPFEEQPWWDGLDIEVRDALLALAGEEGMEAGKPDNYHRGGTALERFVVECPSLDAALVQRYADDDSSSPAAKSPSGIVTWMLENAVLGERFPRRTDIPT